MNKYLQYFITYKFFKYQLYYCFIFDFGCLIKIISFVSKNIHTKTEKNQF